MHPNFVKPRYDQGGFANLPSRIKKTFEENDAKTVVFFFIDGFGWRFYQNYKDHPFFVELRKYGNVEPITSQFPSTTAAHVTAWHTGQPVGESGVFEWTYYEPKLDALFSPLLFSYAGTTERETAKESGIAPSELYPTKTFYQSLAKSGVESHIFQFYGYTPSPYSTTVMQGAEMHPYKTLTEALVNMRLMLEKPADHKRYIAFYFGDVDTILHKYGPDTTQANAEIETTLDTLLNRFLVPLSQQMPAETLFLLTADHGHVEVDPATTVYINVDPAFTGIEKYIKRNQAGEMLAPAGSPRDMFLYIEDEHLDEAQRLLASGFEGKADVIKIQELIDAGYFGETISETFLSRVGNLVILPYRYESVWWFEEGKHSQKHYGHHGGLTAQEMEIPLFLCRF